MKEIAATSRTKILEQFKKAPELPWPITPESLTKMNPVPDIVAQFLSIVIYGKLVSPDDQNKIRTIISIGQDICRAVTH